MDVFLENFADDVGQRDEVHRERGGQEPPHPRLVDKRIAKQVARGISGGARRRCRR